MVIKGILATFKQAVFVSTHTCIQIDRQTDRQTDTDRHRQTDRQTDRRRQTGKLVTDNLCQFIMHKPLT